MLLRLGPAVACMLIGLSRAIWLSGQLSGVDAREVGYLLLSDLPAAAALCLLAYVEALASGKWRALPFALTCVLLAAYVADVFATVELNARLQLSDLLRFSSEIWVAASFLNIATSALIAAALVSLFVRVRVPFRILRFAAAASVALLLVPLLPNERRVPVHLQKYTGSVLLLPAQLLGGGRVPVPEYGGADAAVHRGSYDALFEAPFARSKKDLILVVVESLSAVDSARTSGLSDRLSRFDELSRRGMLFRNFFANYEASEGGIVALLSGVPPLHYPTASTLPFNEYAMQPTMVDAFRRDGYRCEFLTSVPLRFLSMQRYLENPRSGFQSVAGQQEIARFKDAPRFAFESPSDRLLFEELLARLDARPPGPVFLTAATASSHPPFVDPRGGQNSEANVWSYVQDELWWLYDELSRRDFFRNGVLVVVGDHRKMLPVRRNETERYGDSAKARVPLLLIGAGVPSDTVDDRLFQQSDLLRMLDRALIPDRPLSRFVVWVNRYVAVLGFAANASNVEVFEPGNGARDAYPLKLRGAEAEWLRRPADHLVAERQIHQQRAMQQFARAAAVPATVLNFGREIAPSDQIGALVGVSSDLDVTRDPDDPRGGLQLIAAKSLDLAQLPPTMMSIDAPRTVTVRAFVPVQQEGEYWFSVWGDEEICLAIDQRIVLGRNRGFNSGTIQLTSGLHRMDLRFVPRRSGQRFELKWLRPGQKDFELLPWSVLIAPLASGGQ